MKHDYDLEELKTIDVRGLKFNIMPRYTYHYVDQNYEQFSLDLLDRIVEEGGVSIDIGAHYGIYSLLAARKSKKVFAFEPVPENYKILKKNIEANGLDDIITPFNKAVSDKQGTVKFNITWASDSAGFYNHPNAEVIRQIKVSTTAIDSELIGAKDVSFIKIDTEGHEIHVLEGLKNTLKNNKNAKLLIEFNPECLANAGTSSTELLDKIRNLGYDIFALHEATRSIVTVSNTTTDEEILLGEKYLNLLCIPQKTWQSVLLLSHNSGIGGAELVLYETVEGMLKNEETFILPYVIVNGEGPIADKFRRLPVATTVIPMGWWVNAYTQDKNTRADTLMLNIDALSAIGRICNSFKPHVSMTNTLVVPWLAVASKALSIPHVWSIHEFGDLDHELMFDYGYKESLELVDYLSEKILVNSKAVQKHVGRFIPINKMKQLYYNSKIEDQESKALDNSIFSKESHIRLIISGRISPNKGQFQAVKAVKILRDRKHAVELAIMGEIGDDSYANEIREYINKWKLDKYIHIIGYQEDPSKYISIADISLTCSKNEAFGRVTVEAMLMGKPVVGSDAGGTSEIIKDGKTGYLYKPGKSDDLAKKIERIITDESWIRMGIAAKEDAEKRFYNNYYKDVFALLIEASEHDKTALPFFDDLMIGLRLREDYYKNEIRKVEEFSRKELKKFSEEYNKVYKAYNEIEAKMHSPPYKKFRNVIRKIYRLRRGKK